MTSCFLHLLYDSLLVLFLCFPVSITNLLDLLYKLDILLYKIKHRVSSYFYVSLLVKLRPDIVFLTCLQILILVFFLIIILVPVFNNLENL